MPDLETLHLLTSLLDLTSLHGDDTPDTIHTLCSRAHYPTDDWPHVAAVCVYPALLDSALTELQHSPVRVTVVGGAFPSGQYPLDIKAADVARSANNGADEIDIVVNRGLLCAGDDNTVIDEVRTMRAAGLYESRDRAFVLKVILETGELKSAEMIRRACETVVQGANDAGPIADGRLFLKTSTGMHDVGATPNAMSVMARFVRDHYDSTGERIGLKTSGGIRTVEAAIEYVDIVRTICGEEWITPKLFRIGASSLLDVILGEAENAQI